MATQLYLVPIIGTGTDVDPRRPKYSDAGLPLDSSVVTWSAMDFGNEPIMLVATETNAALAAETDVLQIPLDLDQNLTAGAVTAAQTYLEGMNIPADWITTAFTFRRVVRLLACMFQIWQVCQGLGMGKLFGGGVTLSTTFGSLPAGTRALLLQAAQQLNFDTSSLSGASTIRQIIKALMVQFGGSIKIADLTI